MSFVIEYLISYYVIYQGEKELLELGVEKGNLETVLGNVQNRAACLIEEKGNANLSEPLIII